MNLHRLLQGVNLLSSTGGFDKDITGIASDSRAVEPGYAFVCYEGVNVDGHTFIPQAIQNGATTIIGERPESIRRVSPISKRQTDVSRSRSSQQTGTEIRQIA